MNRRILTTAFLGFITIIIINWSCTKLDTTNLGGDLLPVVDNVNTFSTTIDVSASQGLFNDTTSLGAPENQVLGRISNDPIFGKTDARVYVQLKPAGFPYSFTQLSTDSLIGLDSVILCIAYKGYWGDSATLQHITVSEIPSTTAGLWDSIYKPKYLTYAPVADNSGSIIGDQTFNILQLNNIVKFAHDKDSVSGQIRIKLNSSYANKLFQQDSAATLRPGYLGNAFYRDSIFKANFKGLAIEPAAGSQGQALMTISLADPKTHLEVHFRKKRRDINVIDTTYNSIGLVTLTSSTTTPSAVANKVVRDYSGVPWAPSPAFKDEIYLQTTPGTFASLTLPGLTAFRDTNRIIHRAQLRITQIPDAGTQNDKFSPPAFLYLDLKDTGAVPNYKPIYHDLNPSENYSPDNVPAGYFYPSAVEYGYFGGFQKKMYENGSEVSYYDFNITRYIQRMVTQHGPNYDIRLFAPYSFSYPQYSSRIIGYANNLADGRVKVGGTNGPRRMLLTIIWSKINKP